MENYTLNTRLFLYGALAFVPYLLALFQYHKQKFGSGAAVVIDKTEPSKDQIKNEIFASIAFAVIVVVMAVFIESKIILTGNNKAIDSFNTMIGGLLILDVWFYFSHRLMHSKALYFIHRKHHESVVNTAFTGMSFSMLEKVFFASGYFSIMAIASRIVEISFLGMLGVVFVYFVVNSVGHANIESRKSGYSKKRLGKFLLTATFHSMHHKRGWNNFGLIFRLWDRIFSTEWDDYDNAFEELVSEKSDPIELQLPIDKAS